MVEKLIAELAEPQGEPDGCLALPAKGIDMTCEHKRLKHGYQKTYDVQWCLDCGVITHASDGLIGPGLHKRADWSDWINVNLEAWSCRNEAHDVKRCSHWCGGSTCPASIRSVATTTQNDSMQPAHRALLRQYESITELESRLASATERIAALTQDLAAAQADNERLYGWMKTKDGQIATIEADWKKAEAEAAALRADAERYRWLRMNRLWLKANLPMIAAPELDTAIDQARGGGNG